MHESKTDSCIFHAENARKMAVFVEKQPFFWYNSCVKKEIIPMEYYKPFQLKLPLDISAIISIDDPVCTFCEVMSHIDLNKYVAVKGSNMGCPMKSQCTKGQNNRTIRLNRELTKIHEEVLENWSPSMELC